ncbi:MAG: hypothetical protein ABFQ62_00195 [Patescibacteria group bacterium]
MKNGRRQCGECGVCCVVAEVKEGEFNKPACVACQYLTKSGKKRCSIFGSKKRPKICSTFECAWKRGFGTVESRPDKSGVMLTISDFNGGKWIFVLDVRKDAHKITGKSIIMEMINKFNLPAIIVDYDNLKKGKGDYVVLNQKIKSRSSQIMGDFMGNLGNMEIYKLKINNN